MDAIRLNVGGTVYTTSLNTLTKYPDSILAKIVNSTIPYDLIFIDRNATLFGYILEYLRTDCLNLYKPNKKKLITLYHNLLNEAKYFNLESLLVYLENKIKTV